jgi:hypothetical protein
MAGAWYPTIIFAGMNMLEVRSDRQVPRGYLLFFNVGVKGVKEYANVRVANLLGKFRGIGGRVQKVGLEPVYWFDGEGNLMCGERIAQGLKAFDRPSPFIAGSTPAGQVPNRAVERPGNNLHARLSSNFHQVSKVPAGAPPHIRAVTDQAETIHQYGAGITFQAMRLNRLANAGRLKVLWTKQRDFDAVKTSLFDDGQQAEIRLIKGS